MQYAYVMTLDGAETLVTSDDQMFDCIKQGGTVHSVDEDGNVELVADGKHGFVKGRPGFPVYADIQKEKAKKHDDEYRAMAKKNIEKRVAKQKEKEEKEKKKDKEKNGNG